MDLFTHVLAAGLIAELITRAPGSARRHRALVVPVAFFAGGLSHLALDAVPHFGFVPHLLVWGSVPHAWLIRPVLAGLLAMVFVVVHAEGNRSVAASAAVGAIYPDVEKFAHHFWGLPWRLYNAHATATESFSAGLDHRLLASAEIVLSALLAVSTLALAARRTRARLHADSESVRERP